MKKIIALIYLFCCINQLTLKAQNAQLLDFKNQMSCIDGRMGQANGYSFYGYACKKDTLAKRKNIKVIDSVKVTLFIIKSDSIRKYYLDPFKDNTLKKLGTTYTIYDGKFCLEVKLGYVYLINLQKSNYNPLNYIFNTKNTEKLKNKYGGSKTTVYNFSMVLNLENKPIYSLQNNTIFYDKDLNDFRISRGKDYNNNAGTIKYPSSPTISSANKLKNSESDNLNANNKIAKKNNVFIEPNGTSGILLNSDSINRIDIESNKQGKWSYFRSKESKSQIFEGAYTDNQKTGKWINFYPNDTAAIEFNFRNNQATGEYKLFYENGILKSDGSWINNRFNGAFRLYNTTGNLIKDFDYDENGRKSGNQMIYYMNGNLALLASMKDEILDGQTTVYLEDGSTYAKRNYRNGKLISEQILNPSKKVDKKICDTLVEQLFKPDTTVINQLKNSLTQLDSIENKYALMLHDRETLLNEANLTISTQQRELLLKQHKISRIEFENQIKENEIKRQKLFNYFSIAFVLLFLVIIYLVVKSNREKQKVNKELTHQKIQIQKKNTEILDSIEYAKRIQFTLLASDELLQQNLPEHFLFFQPKDIVSGDFYWAIKKENRFYLAVCDSTGHGVPGAFMSVLNATFLNEAINEKNIAEPHQILNHVRQRLVASIGSDGAQDGMDCTLLCFDKTTHQITYAAAYHKPILMLNSQLIELEGDKIPVGQSEKMETFTLRKLPFSLRRHEEGLATIYLFTDGYADQFGGPKGKKYSKGKFKELLLSIQQLPMNEQREALYNAHIEWRNTQEQVDDICMIGVRVSSRLSRDEL